MSSKPSLGIGLVGAGFLAQTRVRCWAKIPGADLLAVASSRADAATSFAQEHGIPSADTSADALFAREDIQVVDLCVPNAAHRSLTERAAAAGKHVICTKPLVGFPGKSADQPGDPVPDAQAMLEACQTAGVELCYAENWIYAPSIRRAADLHSLSEGIALEMYGWEAHSGSHSAHSSSWKDTGGGALLRLAVHPIGAMVQWKHQEGIQRHGKPTRVQAVTAECMRRSAEVEDWGLAILHFEDGSRGIAHGSDNSLGGMQSHLEIRASNSMHQCNLSPHDLLRSWAGEDGAFGEDELMEKAGTQAGWSTPLPNEDWSSGHLGMCAAFAQDLQNGQKPLANGEVGLEVMRILTAAYESAQDGQRVLLN